MTPRPEREGHTYIHTQIYIYIYIYTNGLATLPVSELGDTLYPCVCVCVRVYACVHERERDREYVCVRVRVRGSEGRLTVSVRWIKMKEVEP